MNCCRVCIEYVFEVFKWLHREKYVAVCIWKSWLNFRGPFFLSSRGNYPSLWRSLAQGEVITSKQHASPCALDSSASYPQWDGKRVLACIMLAFGWRRHVMVCLHGVDSGWWHCAAINELHATSRGYESLIIMANILTHVSSVYIAHLTPRVSVMYRLIRYCSCRLLLMLKLTIIDSQSTCYRDCWSLWKNGLSLICTDPVHFISISCCVALYTKLYCIIVPCASKTVVRAFICLSRASSSKTAFQSYGYCRTLIESPMLEVEPTGERGSMVTRGDQNVLEAEKFTSSPSRKLSEIEPQLSVDRKSLTAHHLPW